MKKWRVVKAGIGIEQVISEDWEVLPGGVLHFFNRTGVETHKANGVTVVEVVTVKVFSGLAWVSFAPKEDEGET